MKISWDKVGYYLIKYLPSLVMLAEGLFSFKEKSGAEKKAFVLGATKSVVDAVASESEGGQKETWDEIKEPVDKMIEATVDLANAAGAFKSGSIIDDLTAPLD